MSKTNSITNFPKISRVVAGVSLITAATIGCSDNATNSNVVTDGMMNFPSIENHQLIGKTVFTIPNLFRFLNRYSDDLPIMIEILTEFERDFHQTSHNYFYLSENLSKRIYILQNNYDLFTPIVGKVKNKVELAIEEGLESFELKFVVPDKDEGENEWEDFDWDNPPAIAPNVDIIVNQYAVGDKVDGMEVIYEKTICSC